MLEYDFSISVTQKLNAKESSGGVEIKDSDYFRTDAFLTDITEFIGKNFHEMHDISQESSFKNHFKSNGKYYGKKFIRMFKKHAYDGSEDNEWSASMTKDGWT